MEDGCHAHCRDQHLILHHGGSRYASDPRIKAFRKAKKDAKLAKETSAKEGAAKTKRDAENAAALEAERLEAAEKASRESSKNNKEMSKRAKRGFIKQLKRLKLLEDDGAVPEGGVSKEHADKMKDTLSTERLRELMELPEADLAVQLVEEVQALVSGVARAEPVKKEWSQEEQSKLEVALKTVRCVVGGHACSARSGPRVSLVLDVGGSG